MLVPVALAGSSVGLSPRDAYFPSGCTSPRTHECVMRTWEKLHPAGELAEPWSPDHVPTHVRALLRQSRIGLLMLLSACGVGSTHESQPPRVAPVETLQLRLTRDGAVCLVFPHDSECLRPSTGFHVQLIPPGHAQVTAIALDRVESLLRQELDGSQTSHTTSTTRRALRMEVAADVPWRWVAWILQRATRQGVEVGAVSFVGMGMAEETTVDLPRFDDTWNRSILAPVEIRLFRSMTAAQDTGWTKVRVGVEDEHEALDKLVDTPVFSLEDSPPKSGVGTLAELREHIQHVKEVERDREWCVSNPPPRGSDVPFSDVLLVLQLLDRAGVANVLLGTYREPPRTAPVPR